MAVQTITYDDKSFLNQNQNIADVNKCNDTDMNEIKTVVNNNATILQGATTYSTSETNTGKIWIDGKPIYRKVINCGNLPNASSTTIAHGITSLETYISVIGVAQRSTDNDLLPIPYVTFNANNSGGIAIYCDNTSVHLTTSTNRSGYVGYVTLEYTKTTD